MPNWCEGTLKVRGNFNDLKRFVLEGLQPVGVLGDEKEPLEADESKDYFVISTNETCWIENTHRGFIENLYVYLDEDVDVITLDSKFAWGISAEQLQKTCVKYNVDMKIYAFECGAQFNRDIEIVDGKIIKDNKITFDNYDWECICPNLGG